MQKENNITAAASEYVFNLFKTKLPPDYVYHNFTHTESVAEAARRIAKKSGLDDASIEIVTLAGWFHDAGYVYGCQGHEEKGAQIALEFLKAHNYPEDKITRVMGCILATKMPAAPKDILEEAVCDADLSHLGSPAFFTRMDLLRVEWEKTQGRAYTEREWLETNVNFFTRQNYFTRFAKKEYEEQKTQNLMELQKMLKKVIKRTEKDEKFGEKLQVEKEKLKNKEDAKKIAERGIETMFRNTIRTHVEFSAMADNKANIMISINTLIIGGIVTILLRKLDANPHLILPTFLLLTTSLACIIFAVTVTRPKVTEGKFTKEDIENKRTNLLFFGNFFNMGLQDFEWGMRSMMSDREYLYGSMIKDFYFLGQVLGRKYKYLRIAYTIFLFGLIASVVAYAIAFLAYPTQDLTY
jgi:predicted metal-dependent HD superfamily phosphohydrolase